MGDHAAVYRRPAVLATVDLRSEVVVEADEASGVVAEMVDLGRRWHWSVEEISERTEATRRHWQDYAAEPTPERFETLIGSGDAERLAVLAFGETARALDRAPDGIKVRVSSALPMGAGLGSSASVAAAIVGALLTFWDGRADNRRVAEVVREVERRQHGFPSGVDHQAVLCGGIVWAEPGDEPGTVQVTDLRYGHVPQPLVIDTGSPQQTTGAVVDHVRQRDGVDSALWDEMEATTREFGKALALGADPRPMVRRYQSYLERLGVVPARVAEWIRSWEDDGGAAKVSGAGATRGDRAGCLLVYPPADGALAVPPLPDGWTHIETGIGGPGLRVGVE